MFQLWYTVLDGLYLEVYIHAPKWPPQSLSPSARSILHKNLRQRKLVFQMVLYFSKSRKFFSVVLTIWGALKLISSLELLTNLKVFAEFPEALIAVFVFFI